MELSMSIISWGNLSRSLERFMDESMKWENYRDDIISTMEKLKDKNFQEEGRSNVINPRWAPLSVATAKARTKRTGYYKQRPNKPGILRWTGNLQENIKRIKTAYSCAIVFNASYAIYHQDAQKGTAKHRVFFEFSPSVKAEIMRTIQTSFNREIGIWNARKSS